MGSQATVKLLQDYYAAFNKQDMDTFLSLLTDDVIHDINQGAREVGKDAFVTFMDRMNNHYKETIVDIEVMTNTAGDRAAVEFTVSGEYLATDEGLPEANGQTYKLLAGAFFEIRNVQIARVTNYYNLEDWIAQVST